MENICDTLCKDCALEILCARTATECLEGHSAQASLFGYRMNMKIGFILLSCVCQTGVAAESS